MLFNRIDRDMRIAQALAAPRASQRNTAEITAEPAFVDRYGSRLEKYGHVFAEEGDAFTSAPEIGAATAIELRRRGRMTAVAEPERRGGGSALVVHRRR
jgi:gamma-glutamyltranspeptidase/glutathione hydrolase